jgi:hypothetical protein
VQRRIALTGRMPDESSIRNLVRRLGAEVAEELADVHRVFIADRQSAGARRTDADWPSSASPARPASATSNAATAGAVTAQRSPTAPCHRTHLQHPPALPDHPPGANLQPGPRHPGAAVLVLQRSRFIRGQVTSG